MCKEDLIEKAKSGRVEFCGNVKVSSIWDGFEDLPYYAAYADNEGIHAYPPCFEDFSDNVAPIGFDEIDDETYRNLCDDVI